MFDLRLKSFLIVFLASFSLVSIAGRIPGTYTPNKLLIRDDSQSTESTDSDYFPQFVGDSSCTTAKNYYINDPNLSKCLPQGTLPHIVPGNIVHSTAFEAICSNLDICGELIIDWNKRVYSSCQLNGNNKVSQTELITLAGALYNEDTLKGFCSKNKDGEWCMNVLQKAFVPGISIKAKKDILCSECGKTIYKAFSLKSAEVESFVNGLCGNQWLTLQE